jgi:hypothetical protein
MDTMAKHAMGRIARRISSGGRSSIQSSASSSLGDRFNWDMSNYQPLVNAQDSTKWHAFISNSRTKGGSDAHTLHQHLTHAQALNVWYANDSEWHAGVEEGVQQSKHFILFVTDRYFEDERCLLELQCAIENNRPIVIMYILNENASITDLAEQVPSAIRENLLLEHTWIKYESATALFQASVNKLLLHCEITPMPEAGRDVFESASSNHVVAPKALCSLFQQGSRKFLFDAVDKWQVGYEEGEEWSQIFVLTGEAGVGKSVFASQICAQGSQDFSPLQNNNTETVIENSSSRSNPRR